MLQGQQVYLRIPKATESYSGGCGLSPALRFWISAITFRPAPCFFKTPPKPIGDLIVSMNFLDEYASSMRPLAT